jgi:membrane protein implicated in regulation of membrane protease activity
MDNSNRIWKLAFKHRQFGVIWLVFSGIAALLVSGPWWHGFLLFSTAVLLATWQTMKLESDY